ncbi:MAG: MauE/DoxX family redox-associated membrane protein [Planctomycetota bacterium]
MITLLRVYLLGIGCLLQYTAVTHALNASEFFDILRDHAVIPPVTVIPAAVLVIIAEWAVGLACFIGVARRTLTACSTLVSSMFVLVLTAYLAALALFGGDSSDCGCAVGPPTGVVDAIVRNGILLSIPALSAAWWAVRHAWTRVAPREAARQQMA